MDLRVFFQKVKEVESAIPEDPTVVVSEETPDGGRAGARTEVSRALAARLLVEGRARLATAEETAGYKAAQDAFRQKAAEQALAGKVMISVVPQPVKEPKKPAKD
ncbi:MAG TPA: hypothetical protein VHD76_21300 [Bryobacteraceae bacterium]|jgi:hypothetical protein|nr:hypothetical protein [Bryobacteraceae bacterium]